MLSHDQNDKNLRRDIYALRRALRKDIKEIKELSKDDPLIPTDATSQMKALEKKMRIKAVAKQNTKELLSTYRQLKYIRDLKSSTPSGAIRISETFQPLRERLSRYSKDKQNEFWSIYGGLYKHYSGFEKYKYEIIEYVDELFGTEYSDDILDEIRTLYDTILEQSGGRRSERDIDIRFTNELQNLLYKHSGDFDEF